MHAITITGYGRPADVLRPQDVPDPAAAADEVLVRVEAASVNPADWHLIRGIPRIARLSVGLRRPDFQIPGSDFAGIVESTGPDVTTVRAGDAVFGTTFMAGFGAFADKMAVPERLLVLRPANVSAVEAAAAPLAASTALQALRDHGHVHAGDRVLIVGASGGVGAFAVQLAKHFGAEVTGVASTTNLSLTRSFGADHVLDYTAGDITEHPTRFDLIVQLAGTHSASQLRRLLAPAGTLLQLSGDAQNEWLGPIGRVIRGRLGAVRGDQTVKTFTVQPNRDDLVALAALLATGVLRTHLDQAVGIDDVVGAIERVESGHTRGKIVLRVGPPQEPLRRGVHGDGVQARCGGGARTRDVCRGSLPEPG
jgi:NADPH:quinone reductase-like Zn-dependent oxidoreductase